jgi:hypothetical protein
MFEVTIVFKGIEQTFYLPAVPTIHQKIYIGTGLVEVQGVTFSKNSHKIFLDVSEVQKD